MNKKITIATKIKVGVTAATAFFCINAANANPNVIGFFQSYDNPAPQVWYFNTPGENISDSGYTILIDAFWVNYPFCWGDGSGQPGRGSPIPVCKGIANAPGPGLSNAIYDKFWTNYQGGPAPSVPGEDYNNYWTSLHTSGPQTISNLRNQINSNSTNIKLLASIGGWNMGGSGAGQPLVPKPPAAPAWAALLQSPEAFAKAMASILNIKVNGLQLYDGIDIDIETLYGAGCSATQCTQDDESKAINAMVQSIILFKKSNPNAILSVSPRAADLVCEQKYCSWNNADGVGFVGQILQQLAQSGVYFDDINPQFYNDDPERNIPNSIDNGKIGYGNQVVGMFQKIHDLGIIGPHTSFNIGVLAQTNSGEVDTGGASVAGNPGVPKALVATLWQQLQADPALLNTGIKINGLMNWSANIALHGQGVGGNVRSVASDPNYVVPYNWGSDLKNLPQK